MPISSLVVRTEINSTHIIKEKIDALDDASVSESHDDNIIVVTETNNQEKDKDLWAQIEQIPGVLKCELIYHNFEDEEGYPYE